MPADNQKPDPSGLRMLDFLSAASKEARGGESRELVAGYAKVGWRTIKRFEDAEAWPEKLDDILDGYVRAGDLAHVRQIWRAAIVRWDEALSSPGEGGAPAVPEPPPLGPSPQPSAQDQTEPENGEEEKRQRAE